MTQITLVISQEVLVPQQISVLPTVNEPWQGRFPPYSFGRPVTHAPCEGDTRKNSANFPLTLQRIRVS
jgi:hypothetical protein